MKAEKELRVAAKAEHGAWFVPGPKRLPTFTGQYEIGHVVAERHTEVRAVVDQVTGQTLPVEGPVCAGTENGGKKHMRINGKGQSLSETDKLRNRLPWREKDSGPNSPGKEVIFWSSAMVPGRI